MMKGSMQAATALGIGYVLGRRRKLRTATLMAAATAVGGTAVGGFALKRGMKMIGSTDVAGKLSPQLGEIVDTVRGDLVTAAKGAATAAVNNRIDTLTDSLHDRAERLRNPGEAVGEGVDQAATAGRSAAGAGRRAASGAGGRATSTLGGAARHATGRGRARDEDEHESDEEYESDELDDEAGEEDDYDAEEDAEEEAEPEDDRGLDAEDEDDEDSAPRRPAARRRSPVARARR